MIEWGGAPPLSVRPPSEYITPFWLSPRKPYGEGWALVGDAG